MFNIIYKKCDIKEKFGKFLEMNLKDEADISVESFFTRLNDLDL